MKSKIIENPRGLEFGDPGIYKLQTGTVVAIEEVRPYMNDDGSQDGYAGSGYSLTTGLYPVGHFADTWNLDSATIIGELHEREKYRK